MKKVAVFGASGSVGRQALDVIRANPSRLRACCLGANKSAQALVEYASDLSAEVIALADPQAEAEMAGIDRRVARLLAGPDAFEEALEITRPDIAVIAVSGLAGLPLLAACLQRRIPVALANKESIVAGGELVMDLWAKMRGRVYPVDSEHCAFYQCLGNSFNASRARRFWLTASGGPFRTLSRKQMESVSVDQALSHPTWNMGPKITVDSATLANKGLEVIEASYLFHMPPERIRVVIQPTSLVHSMVEFTDGSVLAQMSRPDMRLPIQKALLGMSPEPPEGMGSLDFLSVGTIEFLPPDMERFAALPLAYEAAARHLGCVYNAADEVAAHAFLKGRIPLTSIPDVIGRCLGEFEGEHPADIPGILALDAQVRRAAARMIEKGGE